jgi:DNA-binding CsgD family transcriptional regulator
VRGGRDDLGAVAHAAESQPLEHCEPRAGAPLEDPQGREKRRAYGKSLCAAASLSPELTPREAQMVELAARGLTNAEIADRIVLSKRTVETHIYRAMRKLDINDRREFPTQS